MIGAGVFAAFTPAAQAAGSGLLVGLAIAALVAFCNATSTAQLAAASPSSGGVYVYGRERLGEWWGFLAGWTFVIGKTASCAAMGLAFAVYAVPDAWQRPTAAVAVAAVVAVNYRGITRTALAARIIVIVVLAVLGLVIAAGATGMLAGATGGGLSGGSGGGPLAVAGSEPFSGGAYGILQAAGLLFFAFAGYARVATLGEEVRDPARTIPRAIVLALALTVLVYGAIAVVLLGVLGPQGLAAASAPLLALVEQSGWGWATPLVTVGATAACLGALLALIAGVGRTTLAMAREGDLPRWLAAVHPRFAVPHRAELAVAAVVVTLVLTLDVRGAIAFSSFGVLLYYFVANLSALRQPPDQRRFPRALAVVGAVACLALVATLPPVA
ncbi:MAG: hypothetical protein RI885_336, partial [Actinomycetota bacterium]